MCFVFWQLLCPFLASRLITMSLDINSTRVVLWPPKVKELEQEEELPPLVIKLLSALQVKKGLDLSPNTLALTSFIRTYFGFNIPDTNKGIHLNNNYASKSSFYIIFVTGMSCTKSPLDTLSLHTAL